MKQENIYFLLLLSIFIFVTMISCDTKKNIQGQWRSAERDLFITQNEFEIKFNNPKNVLGLKGNVKYSSNILEIQFNQYKVSEVGWQTIDNSELIKYKEKMRYRIVNNELETFIEATGRVYKYVR